MGFGKKKYAKSCVGFRDNRWMAADVKTGWNEGLLCVRWAYAATVFMCVDEHNDL